MKAIKHSILRIIKVLAIIVAVLTVLIIFFILGSTQSNLSSSTKFDVFNNTGQSIITQFSRDTTSSSIASSFSSSVVIQPFCNKKPSIAIHGGEVSFDQILKNEYNNQIYLVIVDSCIYTSKVNRVLKSRDMNQISDPQDSHYADYLNISLIVDTLKNNKKIFIIKLDNKKMEDLSWKFIYELAQ